MENVKLTKLNNGLRVVTKTMDNLSSVALGYWVKIGGVCENSSNYGISHFLEHMAFKGTTTRSAKRIADEIESVGGYLNAYTSKEVTAFHSKLLCEDKALAIDILSDILQNPTFLSEELERERGVILQEFFQTRDTPDDIIFDHFQHVAFGDQSLGMPILGTEKHISSISADDLRNYLADNYKADKIIFAAVGNVSHEEILDYADKYFSKFSSRQISETCSQFKYIGGSYSDTRDIEQVHAVVGFDGVSCKSPDYYTMAIMSSILGGGMSSRLFQEIREKRGLVYSIYSFSNSYTDNGAFGVYAATTADKLKELSDVLAAELKKIPSDIISQEEFKRTKAQFKAALLMSAENNISSCEQIVNQTAVFGAPIPREQILQKIEAVTIEDVQRLAAKVFASKTSVVTVGKCDCSNVLKSLQANGFTTE